MTSKARLRTQLASFVGSEEIVRVRRVSRPGYTIDGFVVAVGHDWVVLTQVSEGGYFNGYAALRIADVKHVKSDTSFHAEFSRTQPEWPPALPATDGEVDLDSTRGMLRTLLRAGGLVGIERDTKHDALWIGVPSGLTKRWLYLWEVDSTAAWHRRPSGFRIGSITTVIFDDRYQRALGAVAAEPPAEASATWGRKTDPGSEG